ncbi:MAG TPA: hypothetical protein VNX46_19090, partial [Candidatus Acidoferrum sp.]|nr:hypothetical protein [Candidatus Acidoferrum sp.]
SLCSFAIQDRARQSLGRTLRTGFRIGLRQAANLPATQESIISGIQWVKLAQCESSGFGTVQIPYPGSDTASQRTTLVRVRDWFISPVSRHQRRGGDGPNEIN